MRCADESCFLKPEDDRLHCLHGVSVVQIDSVLLPPALRMTLASFVLEEPQGSQATTPAAVSLVPLHACLLF